MKWVTQYVTKLLVENIFFSHLLEAVKYSWQVQADCRERKYTNCTTSAQRQKALCLFMTENNFALDQLLLNYFLILIENPQISCTFQFVAHFTFIRIQNTSNSKMHLLTVDCTFFCCRVKYFTARSLKGHVFTHTETGFAHY